MSYQVLARKYRPQRFSEVVGQEHVTRTLRNAIEQRRIAHGYIFAGHRGIGKTTVARILAMALNCRSTEGGEGPKPEPCGVCESCGEIRAGNSVDVIEIDAATNRGIDEIRELREAARYRPARDRYKIYILDEAHQITDAAFNALLKTLEEPPPHIIFMMATTQAEDIPHTIRSRCQSFSFRAVKFDQIVDQLREIAGKEGVQADEEALAVLAEAGEGSMRDALSVMDQAIAGCGGKLEGPHVRELLGAASPEALEELMDAVARSSTEDALHVLDRRLGEGHNPRDLARQLASLLRNALVAKVAGQSSPLLQISPDEQARAGRVGQPFSEEDLARFLQVMLRTYDELGYRPEQRFHLELGVLKLVHAQRLLPLEQILSQVASELPAAGRPGAPPAASASSPPASSRAGESGAGFKAVNSSGQAQPKSSPLESDRARKGVANTEAGNDPNPNPKTSSASPVELRSPGLAPVIAEPEPVPLHSAEPASAEPASAEPASAKPACAEPTPKPAANMVPAGAKELAVNEPAEIMARVLDALDQSGHHNLAATLAEARVTLQGNELVVQLSHPAAVIPFIMSPAQKSVAVAAASAAAGRSLKVTLAGNGGNGPAAVPIAVPRGGKGARSRASDDPIVQRMLEKFGAEIRTVIDHRDKN